MKKNGFIATSLIYSFFLVFIAVIAAIINSYISNKTILDRYNEEVQDKLNNETYTVILRVKNASIVGGEAMTNLIQNSNFTSGLDFWNSSSLTHTDNVNWKTKYAIRFERKTNTEPTLSQNIYTIANHNYYYLIDYDLEGTSILKYKLAFEEDLEDAITIDNGLSIDGFQSISNMYNASSSGNQNFSIMTLNNPNSTSYGYFTNILLLDLTEIFGTNREPSKEWLDRYITWFDGTINFIVRDKIKKGDSTQINLIPFSGYTCKKDNLNVQGGNFDIFTNATIDDNNLTLSSINDNITLELICEA